VVFGGTALIKKGNEAAVLMILICLIFVIIWLYVGEKDTEKKYEQLLHFSYKFYKKVKKMEAIETDGYDHGDYTSGDFEEEFENWLKDEHIK